MLAINIPQYQFHSGVIARQVASQFDLPYGHNNSITLFGQTKNFPAIALLGAGLSISGGVALLSTSAFLGGMMIAGGVFSIVGTLTGNKTLSNIGMGLSLAGGIGTAFVDSATGAFANPFSDGNFSKSIMGSGLKSMLGDVGGNPQELANLPASSGDAMTQNVLDVAKGDYSNVAGNVSGNISDASSVGSGLLKQVNLADTTKALSDVAGTATGAVPKSTGLLSSLGLDAKDGLAIAQGVSGAFNGSQTADSTNELNNANVNNINSTVDTRTAQNERLLRQEENMNASPSIDILQGQDAGKIAQIMQQQTNKLSSNAGTPSQAPTGKIAVLNPATNQMEYLTSEQYMALRSQGNEGLLSSKTA
jgi:hypothetical protein